MKKLILGVAVSTAVVLGMASSAINVSATVPTTRDVFEERINRPDQPSADPFEIPVNTVSYGDKGSEKELSSKTIENGEYTVRVETANNASVHPGSDIIVRSGISVVTVANVESKAEEKKTADSTLKVDNGKVTVLVRFGDDRTFSGGVKLTLTKVATPAAPQTTNPAPTPTPPAPTPAPSPAPSPTPSPTPAPQPTPAIPGKTGEIPNTGPASVAATALAAGGAAYAASLYLQRRRIASQED